MSLDKSLAFSKLNEGLLVRFGRHDQFWFWKLVGNNLQNRLNGPLDCFSEEVTRDLVIEAIEHIRTPE